MFKCRIMVVLRLMRNEKFWSLLGREALGSWVRELRAGLDLGFLDFLLVFSLGKMVPFVLSFIMCKVIKSFPLQLCRFELIWHPKKKHISKMTGQLTAKSNWGCDLLTKPNVMV